MCCGGLTGIHALKVDLNSELVKFATVTGRDQIVTTGSDDVPYKLVTAVSRLVDPRGCEDGMVAMCETLVRTLDWSSICTSTNVIVASVSRRA